MHTWATFAKFQHLSVAVFKLGTHHAFIILLTFAFTALHFTCRTNMSTTCIPYVHSFPRKLKYDFTSTYRTNLLRTQTTFRSWLDQGNSTKDSSVQVQGCSMGLFFVRHIRTRVAKFADLANTDVKSRFAMIGKECNWLNCPAQGFQKVCLL